MRHTLSALVVAAGLLGLGAATQAAPLPAGTAPGASSPVEQVQMTRMERRMMHRRMERRMARRHMRHRMMRREMRRDMMRRGM